MEPFNAYESIVSLEISAMRYAKIAIRMSFRSITIPDGKSNNNQIALKCKNHRPSKFWNDLKRIWWPHPGEDD
jgi:hypothetical protein